MKNRNVVVVGTSMGGVEALKILLKGLPADFEAGICVVLHISTSSSATLANSLNRHCELEVVTAQDGDPFKPGRVYLAAPDQHLLLKRDQLRLFRGPRENRVRPAIDPLFRSAAVAYGSRVIGVILTGLLNDGSSGLAAVKRCGGVTIIQDPADAAYPDMPLSAQCATDVDYSPSLNELPELLKRLVKEVPKTNPPAPKDIAIEVGIAESIMSNVPRENTLGDPAPLGCPECGGPLWEMQDSSVSRYRCHVGHGYTAQSLLAEQCDAIDKALWVALRTLEERAGMLRRLAQSRHKRNHSYMLTDYIDRAGEAEEHAASIRKLLSNGLATA